MQNIFPANKTQNPAKCSHQCLQSQRLRSTSRLGSCDSHGQRLGERMQMRTIGLALLIVLCLHCPRGELYRAAFPRCKSNVQWCTTF